MTDDIERRLRRVEDRLAIADLIAAYGPAVDRGDAVAVAGLWVEGGTFRVDGTTIPQAEMAWIVDNDTHRGYLTAGCAHVISAPAVEIQGDTAVAVTHSVVLIHRGDQWIAERASANRWDFVRTPAGWRIRDRVNRLLDGDAEARALLGSADPF